MEISRRLLKWGEARSPYKSWIERCKKRKQDNRQRDESYLESLGCLLLVPSFPWSGSSGSLIGFPMFLSWVSYRQKCILSRRVGRKTKRRLHNYIKHHLLWNVQYHPRCYYTSRFHHTGDIACVKFCSSVGRDSRSGSLNIYHRCL